VLACDLDRTLIAKDGMLPPRTEAAIRAARAAGIRVIIATGRMFVSVRPYVLQAGIDDPVVCYQGAVVAEPKTGRWLRHEPIPVALAKEAIAAIVAEGFHVNVYVDDELFVGKVTPEARAYADFQGLVIHEVGDLAAWLEKPATKVVFAPAQPNVRLQGSAEALKRTFAGRPLVEGDTVATTGHQRINADMPDHIRQLLNAPAFALQELRLVVASGAQGHRPHRR